MTLPTSLALGRCVIRADDVDPVVLVAHHPLVHVNDVVRVGDLEAGGGINNNNVDGYGSDNGDNGGGGDNDLSHGVCCIPIKICHSRGTTSVRPG